MRKKAVELPGVTLGEGMPKVCVPVMGADARALRAAADAARATRMRRATRRCWSCWRGSGFATRWMWS